MLPQAFVSLMQQQWGEDRASLLCDALMHTEPSVSVRVNPEKAVKLQGGYNVQEDYDTVPWCTNAYYLAERPAFTFDPLLHAGVYYVQEASSMFLAHVLQPYLNNTPLIALDLCAAPGGKSTLLRSILPQGSMLVSNEPMRQRAQILAENMTKWGNPNVVVTQNYPEDFAFLTHQFDLIVTDVPCSGEGMFRKDEVAVQEWNLDNVETCWHRQRDILTAIWPTLKPGGLLVYSTCTFNRFEDEDNVRWIASQLGADILPIPHKEEWGICDEGAGCHFFPGSTRGEGFFIAVLRKHQEETVSHIGGLHYSSSAKVKIDAQIQAWLQGDYTFNNQKDSIVAYPCVHAALMGRLTRGLHVLHAGVTVAQLKGRDWIPAHSLAMSTDCSMDIFPRCELTYEQSLAYLRKEVLRIDALKGFVLVTYRGIPLGFVKNIGNRANNLYPQEWRIRSTYTTMCNVL